MHRPKIWAIRLWNLLEHTRALIEFIECDTEVVEVVITYSKDLDSFQLKGQLMLLTQTAESIWFETAEFDVNDLVTFLQSLHFSRWLLLSEISTLGKLLLVMPATNAASEWSFSALNGGWRRICAQLRNTEPLHEVACSQFKVNTNGKLETVLEARTRSILDKCILDKCSYLTCTRAVCFNRG